MGRVRAIIFVLYSPLYPLRLVAFLCFCLSICSGLIFMRRKYGRHGSCTLLFTLGFPVYLSSYPLPTTPDHVCFLDFTVSFSALFSFGSHDKG